jgi:hypothetical protein
LVLQMSDEIDTRERMLDVALGSAGRGPDRVDVTGSGSRPERRRGTSQPARRGESLAS